METPNYRKASIYFDDETVLEVTQRGGGGSGVGGETGLAAVNLKTGESTNAALAAKDETIAEQAATIIELQEELADVPTIEALNVTSNGTYSEAGKAYSPVSVNVVSEDPTKQIWNVFSTIINLTGNEVHLVKPEVGYANPTDDGYYKITVGASSLTTGTNSPSLGSIGGHYNAAYANYRYVEFYIDVPRSQVSVNFPSDWSCQLRDGFGVFNNWTRFTLRYLATVDIDANTVGVTLGSSVGTITLNAA